MEHALATGLYTTGAGQSSTMLVTELGPSLAMLGPLHQELSNVRLTPQLGGLLAHGGTTELRRDTKAEEHWPRATLFHCRSRCTGCTCACWDKGLSLQELAKTLFATAPRDSASALPLTTALIIGDLRRWKTQTEY